MAIYSKTAQSSGNEDGIRKLGLRIRMSFARTRAEKKGSSDDESAVKSCDPPDHTEKKIEPELVIPEKPADLPLSESDYNMLRNALSRQKNTALAQEGYTHSLDVARWCVRVAKRRGVNEHIACMTGLMHDIYYYATGLKPLGALNAAEYTAWLMRRNSVLTTQHQAAITDGIREYACEDGHCEGMATLLRDAHILCDYTGAHIVRDCDLKHLMELVPEWKLLEPQRGQVKPLSHTARSCDRNALAEVAQTLASQRISWYAGESDAVPLVKYWLDGDAFERLSKQWSAAFVYHCCYEAGFILPLHDPRVENGFDEIKGWLDFGSLLSNGFYHPKGESGFVPERGDIVIFDRMFEDKQPADHMGVVVMTAPERITVAEGNARQSNVSDVIEHSATHHVRGYIRLPNWYQFH